MDTVFLLKSSAIRSGFIIGSVSAFADVSDHSLKIYWQKPVCVDSAIISLKFHADGCASI